MSQAEELAERLRAIAARLREPGVSEEEAEALSRERATSHVVYGENVAILAGDGLFAEAVRLFCENQEGEPRAILAALAELLAAIGVDGMVGGQYMDVTTQLPAAPAKGAEGDRWS